MTVEDLMSVALVTARPDDSATKARLAMRYADVRHLPVVDGESGVVGIVSDRDLLRKGRAKGLRVRDVMTRRVRTIPPTRPARDAAGIMLEHHIGALPVVGVDGRLLGLVTETDFLRALVR